MDEGKSWAVSLLSPGDIVALSEIDHHSPLYFILLKLALSILPSTEAGLRTISVVASACALIAVLAFLRSEWSMPAAIYAGVLMALSSFDLYYAQEARMYTLLAALWIVSYVVLVKALQGNSRWLIVWVIVSIALPWTHMYGFLILGANVAFIVVALLLQRLHRLTMAQSARLWIAALVVVGLGSIPMVRLLLLHSDTTSLGASLPGPNALIDLFLLWSVGLTAVRQHFLDSAHLVLPATAGVQPAVWFFLGLIICGLPAIYGLLKAWQMAGTQRMQAALTLFNILLPIAVAMGYSRVTGNRIWVQRPFLGAAYLLYMWAGIGLSTIKLIRLRWVLVPLALVVALASLLPYFTVWKKSDAAQALTTMPPPDEQNALVLQMRFLASQARFYLGDETPLLTVEVDKKGMPFVARPVFGEGHAYHKVMGQPGEISCNELGSVTDLWLYGDSKLVRETLPQLPGCITEKNLWLYEETDWIPAGPVSRDTIVGSGWLQYDDIRDSDWTTQSYRHIAPGEEIRVTLTEPTNANHALTIGYYDYPGKKLEVWVAGQLIDVLGEGKIGTGWVEQNLDLPVTHGKNMEIEVRNVGETGSGVTYLGITPAK